jgi:hypothetical protein
MGGSAEGGCRFSQNLTLAVVADLCLLTILSASDAGGLRIPTEAVGQEQGL